MGEITGADAIARDVARGAGWLILLGVGLTFLGALALGAPLVAGYSMAMLVGMLILAGGLVRIVFAFRAKTWGKGLPTFLLGALGILCGLVMLAHPLYGLAWLTLILAVWFVFDGITEIALAFQLKPLGGWVWTLFSGVVAVLLGVMIWRQWPLSGAWAIGVLVGIKMIFAGWGLIGLGLAGRGAATDATAGS